MSDTNQKRLCKKCLLYDSPQAQYFTHLYEYINNLDNDIKIDDKEYDKRLNACLACEDYLQGMCRICGCFVELRAVIRENECAAPNKKW